MFLVSLHLTFFIRIIDSNFSDFPEPPYNCSLQGGGETWLSVHCDVVDEGGLPQTHVAEIWKSDRFVANTSQTGETLQFRLTGLDPAVNYTIKIHTRNAKSSSPYVNLQGATSGNLITQRRTTGRYAVRQSMLYFTH